jgi:hypothetical protein
VDAEPLGQVLDRLSVLARHDQGQTEDETTGRQTVQSAVLLAPLLTLPASGARIPAGLTAAGRWTVGLQPGNDVFAQLRDEHAGVMITD